jgi:hypothetical protein
MFRKIYGTYDTKTMKLKLTSFELQIGFLTFCLATPGIPLSIQVLSLVSAICLTPLPHVNQFFPYLVSLSVKIAIPSNRYAKIMRYQKIKKPRGRIDHPGGDSHL